MKLIDLTTPELCYLHRYFSAVGNALASRMREGSTPSEENLTFLLCELMDEGMTSRHVLEYSLEELNRDLEQCGVGNRVEISFETNEHTRYFDGKYSFADLGIVFERHDIFDGMLRKALLVQSKRLYHDGNREFSLGSKYGGYDQEQFDKLKETRSRLYARQGIYYFLYNPDLEGIREDERDTVKALEAVFLQNMGFSDLKSRHYWEVFGRPLQTLEDSSGADKKAIDQMRDLQQEELLRRPGIRVCGMDAMSSVAERARVPRLLDFYHEGHERGVSGFGEWCLFETFADFMVYGVIGCNSGSEEKGLIALAEGRKPPDSGDDEGDPWPDGVGARHTLRIRLHSVHAHEG